LRAAAKQQHDHRHHRLPQAGPEPGDDLRGPLGDEDEHGRKPESGSAVSTAPPRRARPRATPARTHDRSDVSGGSGGLLVAAAQILLGATLSCLLAILSIAALGGIIILIIYVTR